MDQQCEAGAALDHGADRGALQPDDQAPRIWCSDWCQLACGAVGCCWNDVIVEALSEEFREDVVAVARRRDPGVQIRQIAADSGISES